MNPFANANLPGWGWPIAVVVVVHLGLMAIPLQFTQAHSEQRPMVSLSMEQMPQLAPEPAVDPLDNDLEPERVEELKAHDPTPDRVDEPEPVEAPIKAQAPDNEVASAEVAIADEAPQIEEDSPDSDELIEPPDEVVQEQAPQALELPDRNFRRRSSPPEPEVAAVDWQGYGQGLMHSVQAHQDYPRMARRMGWEGVATVRITVDRSGALTGAPELVDSSTHDTLDEKALQMVDSAAPFESFPSGAEEEEREFVIPVRFQLQS